MSNSHACAHALWSEPLCMCESWTLRSCGWHLGLARTSDTYLPMRLPSLWVLTNPGPFPVFHAFTGCDTVSAFATRGKKTAWDTWNADDMATEAFMVLSNAPKSIPEEVISIVKCFTILLYHSTSSHLTIDQAHLELFTKKGRGMEQIPPN